MDCGDYKLYLEHSFDSRQYLEHYCSNKAETVFREDLLIFPIENMIQIFRDGLIKGEILIDLSSGSLIQHLYAACGFFKNTIVLKSSGRCIMELKRWLDTRTGAFDWRHVTKLQATLEGSCDQLQDKEGKLRSAVQHVMKCDLQKKNIVDPMVLPPADCIISVVLLDNICRSKDDYIRCLGKFSELLKPGGHLILIGTLEKTFFTVGKDKFRAFKYDEDFAKNALVGGGFVIDYCKVKTRTAVSDLVDYKSIMCIAAHKK